MPSPGSCFRCRRPLPVDSADEMCPTCAKAHDTSLATGAPDPATNDRTLVVNPRAAGRSAADTPTVGADFSVVEFDPTPLPPAPAGYELIRRLGIGGMGVVYLAREQATERLVAMKFLRGGAGHPMALDRFLVEVRALAKLDHPNIVQVIATDFLRADPFFTMEYVGGTNLARLVAAEGPLPPPAAARVVATIARAMHAAHREGVIHRDLKPSNILLGNAECGMRNAESKPENPGLGLHSEFRTPHSAFQPKVSDFGLAKRLDRDDAVTLDSGPLGTPGYMAPEQVSAKCGAVDARTDVYGLGATLYHVLTARAPFTADTPAEIIPRVLAEEPDRPRVHRPELPLELEAVVVKCLAKDPAKRYPTAEAVADDLDRYLAGTKPAAPLQTRPRRVRQYVARHRGRVAAAVVALLAAAGLVVAGVAMAPVPPPAGSPPDPYADIQKEFAAGKRVTLIDAKGPPRWHQTRIGSPPGVSPKSEGACYLDSTGYGILDVSPPVTMKRYAVTAELRQVQIVGVDNPNNPPTTPDSFVGLYLADAPLAGPNGATAYHLININFHDYDWHAVMGLRPPTPGTIQFQDALIAFHPDRTPSSTLQLASHPFEQGTELPGLWRTVRFEVTPAGVQAFWLTDNGMFVRFERSEQFEQKPRIVPVIAGRRNDYPDRLNNLFPGAGLTLPEWSPRMVVGLWCRKAGVAVRRCVVEPLD